MNVVWFILAVIGCVLCHKLSADYDQYVKDKFHRGCISWGWSVVTAVLLTATLLTIGEDLFWLFLLLTIVCAALSAWITYRNMTAWGATSREAGVGGAAQVASAIGIAAAIIFLLALFLGGSKKKRRRR